MNLTKNKYVSNQNIQNKPIKTFQNTQNSKQKEMDQNK